MAVMTSRQASELDFALEGNGWTAEDVKKVCAGTLLAQLLLVVRGRAEVVTKSILTFLRVFKVATQHAVQTSKEYFKEAGIKSVGSNFQAQFLDLVVAVASEAELAVHKLEENSLDEPIMKERGDKTETSVSQFHTFLAAHRESQEWFIFYLRGKDGNLWAVRAGWDSDLGGWRVEARPVASPRGWGAGHRVVSCN